MFIKLASVNEISSIKAISDCNKKELGFVNTGKIKDVVINNRCLVAVIDNNVVGFVFYRHRKHDFTTTISDICVSNTYRNKGIAKKLVYSLISDCVLKSRQYIQLKCPIDLQANLFYEKIGFDLVYVEYGKKRMLNVWRYYIWI